MTSIVKTNWLLSATLIALAIPRLPAGGQETTKLGMIASSQPHTGVPDNSSADDITKEPYGLINTKTLGKNAALESAARLSKIESGDDSNKVSTPLKTVIGVQAEMNIDGKEIALGYLRGLTVEVKNNTDRPLIFHGGSVRAVISGKTIECASESAVRNIINPVHTPKEKIKTDFVNSVVALGTTGVVPTTKGFEQQSRPVLSRYGTDEQRRENEKSQFSDRIVWPGESTKGVVYFAGDQALTGAEIQMPVSSLYDTSDQASIVQVH
jgi:hypothetical protein